MYTFAMAKMCKDHPEVPAANGNKCRPCYNSYMAEYNLSRYHRIRNEMVAELGGKCVDCQTDEELQLDHNDRSSKVVEIGELLEYNELKLKEEISKCLLRCKPCHIAKSKREGDYRPVQHGAGIVGKKGCACLVCGPLKDKYESEFKERYDLHVAERRAARVTCACGAKKYRKSKMCLKCKNDSQRVDVFSYPPLDTLVGMVRESGYRQTGIKLGISDTAIKKHFTKYGLDPKAIKREKISA